VIFNEYIFISELNLNINYRNGEIESQEISGEVIVEAKLPGIKP
jgi:hypothetical protein